MRYEEVRPICPVKLNGQGIPEVKVYRVMLGKPAAPKRKKRRVPRAWWGWIPKTYRYVSRGWRELLELIGAAIFFLVLLPIVTAILEMRCL